MGEGMSGWISNRVDKWRIDGGWMIGEWRNEQMSEKKGDDNGKMEVDNDK